MLSLYKKRTNEISLHSKSKRTARTTNLFWQQPTTIANLKEKKTLIFMDTIPNIIIVIDKW
jgi:hypothetical protein